VIIKKTPKELFHKKNDSTNIQVICGCFKGNLEQFEEKVKETHKGNQYERDYLLFIEKVKIYMEFFIV